MPRGKRVLTLDKQIEKVDKDIAAAEAKIAELKAKKEELESQKKTDKTSDILKLMNENGITVEDIKALQKGNKADK